MLLSNRRIALLHLLLAGIQATWISALFLFLWPRALPVGTGYGIVVAGLLAWMLALELLSRAVASPLYDALALGALVVVSLLLAWVVLRPANDVNWLGAALGPEIAWRGLSPVVVLVGLNVLLWRQATAATSRELNFFSVGVTFRTGLLLLLLGGSLLAGLRGVNALGLLWLHLGLGLSAVAISRVSEKASEAQSIGRLLPARRVVQVGLAAGAATGLTWLFSLVYTGRGITAVFRLLDPVWQWLKPLGIGLLAVIGRALNPVLLAFEDWLSRLLRQGGLNGLQIGPGASAGTGTNPLEGLPRWPFQLAQTAIIAFVLITSAIGVVIFLLLYLERVRKGGLRSEDEDEGVERATMGGGILRRAADNLRGLGTLVRRFGIGWELLAAISVENIYANLCRIARQRGHARRISQPPDDYLPVLAEVFPGQGERLGRITNAYMRVHYGEHPVRGDELTRLRADYAAVRAGERVEADASSTTPAT